MSENEDYLKWGRRNMSYEVPPKSSELVQRFYGKDLTDGSMKWFGDAGDSRIAKGSIVATDQFDSSGKLLGAYAGGDSVDPMAWTSEKGLVGISNQNGFGIGNWFSQNKDLIGAGLGLGQLGLGYLNYTANKKGLESDLASAEQARRLNEERAQNKRNIQGKAQSALRFG